MNAFVSGLLFVVIALFAAPVSGFAAGSGFMESDGSLEAFCGITDSQSSAVSCGIQSGTIRLNLRAAEPIRRVAAWYSKDAAGSPQWLFPFDSRVQACGHSVAPWLRPSGSILHGGRHSEAPCPPSSASIFHVGRHSAAPTVRPFGLIFHGGGHSVALRHRPSGSIFRGSRPSATWTPTTELRAFALSGLHEFSAFGALPAAARAVGETALPGAPFDPHAEDPWFGFDKAQHLAFSFLWTLGTQYVAVNKGHLSEAQALPLSIGTSAAVGVSKEIYDLHSGPPNVFSYRDLVADGMGILLAVGIILL